MAVVRVPGRIEGALPPYFAAAANARRPTTNGLWICSQSSTVMEPRRWYSWRRSLFHGSDGSRGT